MAYCSCCAEATHVATPLRPTADELSNEKARERDLWKEHGPWAARRCVACLLARNAGYIAAQWDWAAQSLIAPHPPLFRGVLEPVHANSPMLSPKSAAPDTIKDDGPKTPKSPPGSPKLLKLA